MKVVFMGTPDFSVSILKAIYEAGHRVCACVTGEDKKRGRGREVSPTPVKEYALKRGLNVYQPHILKCEETVSYLKGLSADIFVVAAYGKILSSEILSIPKYGCINVHASLLPKYRGASPIQSAVIAGDKISGVTIMQMNEGLDTGDILMQESIEIAADETGESLFLKLADLGAELIVSALERIEAGEITAVKQDESRASYTKLISKDMGKLDLNKSAEHLERLIRGMYSWPGTYLVFSGKKIKVFCADVIKGMTGESPGTVISADKEGIRVQTGEGLLNITDLQAEGKKRMPVNEFIKGFKIDPGDKFE
ncbi:MAG: methionyl-tRNA formyltransferase [Lachnospiraceae bacterium]|nr:methionyl-tRNA formyltransferase [Lachnospiraceae bacterium]